MTPGSKLRRRIFAAAMLTTVFVLVLLVHLLSPPASGLWMQIFADSVHVPIFGVIALCLFLAAGNSGDLGVRKRAALAIGAALLLGALSEAAQIPGPRHASLGDLLSDWLGAIGVVLVAAAVAGRHELSSRLRSLSAIAGVSLLLVALAPLIAISAAYLERNLAVPRIVDFDSRFGRRFILTQHASLDVSRREGGGVAEISLLDGPWPGIILHDVWPDWTSYSTLVIELGMADDTPLDINIRVHDRRHRLGKQPYKDRFNMEYTLDTGRHAVRIPLSRIREAPAGRELDLAEIDGIVIYGSSQQAGRTFQLDSIYLE